jgi:branched-subunit amino acid transport protein AzlD
MKQDKQPYARLLPVGISAVLFIIGMILQQHLHNTPYSFAEYVVFGIAFLMRFCGMRYGTSCGAGCLTRIFS